MRELTTTPEVRDFTIPEGCPCCAADLEVRVVATNGANGVCKGCGWMGHPRLKMTHRGLNVTFNGARA